MIKLYKYNIHAGKLIITSFVMVIAISRIMALDEHLAPKIIWITWILIWTIGIIREYQIYRLTMEIRENTYINPEIDKLIPPQTSTYMKLRLFAVIWSLSVAFIFIFNPYSTMFLESLSPSNVAFHLFKVPIYNGMLYLIILFLGIIPTFYSLEKYPTNAILKNSHPFFTPKRQVDELIAILDDQKGI